MEEATIVINWNEVDLHMTSSTHKVSQHHNAMPYVKGDMTILQNPWIQNKEKI